ncbi:MAG: nucleotide sugar dehydrogenase [bacterium]|nr:nucleotide sugar dehydrogenase [bacterium]
MNYKEQLLQKFQKREAVIGVIGLGYVGLPLAVETAKAGYQVIGIEVDPKKIDAVNAGKNYILDVNDAELAELVKAGKIRATNDYNELKNADVAAITVPTPLNKSGDPDMTYVDQALKGIVPIVHPGFLVTLESTTYPGTTNELMVPALTKGGLTIGVDVFAAFSPERVDPGNPVYNTKNTPKVVGGSTPACLEVAGDFYETVIANIVRVNSATAAEMVKLYENTFRAINIGLVNELAMMCNVLKVDVWEIVRAAATKPFGFMPFWPGPGIGGHCIPLDPSYLSWKLRFHGYRARFIELAVDINSHMPEFVVNRVIALLNEEERSIKGTKVLLLGMAYKRDIDDVRESPALDVLAILRRHGAKVDYHDPHIPKIKDVDDHDHVAVDDEKVPEIHSVPLTPENLAKYDVVIVTTDHTGIDYPMVLEHAKLVFDARNAMVKYPVGKAKVVKL